MQAIMETGFDIVYLCTVIGLGIYMLLHAKKDRESILFGIMAIVLGCGDAFHLVPRAYALCTNGLENHVFALGIGKFITSVTMTAFYVILYAIARMRYKLDGKKGLDLVVWVLAALRIALCLFPQNAWTSPDAPVLWGIIRNLPFAALGILLIVLFYQNAYTRKDTPYRFMWLAISLSFGFYIPVVLWADVFPLVGTLMIPKTCAYVWVAFMGYNAMVQGKRRSPSM